MLKPGLKRALRAQAQVMDTSSITQALQGRYKGVAKSLPRTTLLGGAPLQGFGGLGGGEPGPALAALASAQAVTFGAFSPRMRKSRSEFE